MRNLYFLLFSIFALASSCHKEEKITTDAGAKLEFSRDTVFFDTLFTSTQSITKRLRVYNRNSKAVVIQSIEVGGKSQSQYQVIINGLTTYFQNNLTLRGGDSLFILVSTKIPSQAQELPFLVQDSIVFSTNGNIQQVQLIAYGQNATFINGATIPCDTQWTSEKPFVLYNTVRIAPGCTLTIRKAVKAYFHKNATLKVEGTLIVKGENGNEVLFAGDNLSAAFDNLPGQWNGIIFEATSKGNSIEYCTIKNAVTGIALSNDPLDNDTIADLQLNNSIIKNMQINGISALGRDVQGTNCLFTNTVRSSFAGEGGGNYYFDFCTFANYSYDFFREDSTVTLSNTALTNNGFLTGAIKSRLRNCIVWGDYPGEIRLVNDGSSGFDFTSINSLLKTTIGNITGSGNLINQDPKFVSPVKKDFQLSKGSPAIDAGIVLPVTIDLEGKTRSNPPDIGAYEK